MMRCFSLIRSSFKLSIFTTYLQHVYSIFTMFFRHLETACFKTLYCFCIFLQILTRSPKSTPKNTPLITTLESIRRAMHEHYKDISFVFCNATTALPGLGMWLDAVFWGAVKQAANDTPCHHSKAARVTHANPGNALVGHRVIVTVPGNLSRLNTTTCFFFFLFFCHLSYGFHWNCRVRSSLDV